MHDKEYTEDKLIRIASKPLERYLQAIAVKLENYELIELTAFGRNLEKAFHIAEKAPLYFAVRVEKIESFTQANGHGLEHKGIKVILRKYK